MKSIFRLKKNYQYNFVYKHAESVADKNFIMLYCEAHSVPTKVGFSISKKYGKAVHRNRIRRQLKAAASGFMEKVSDGYHVVFIPRRHSEYRFNEVRESVERLFVKSGLMQ